MEESRRIDEIAISDFEQIFSADDRSLFHQCFVNQWVFRKNGKWRYALQKDKSGNCTYILRCGDGSLYTGWTNDLEKRLKAHISGHGAKYTKGRGPLELVFVETFETKEAAMREEYRIKHLTRVQKLRLIEEAKMNEKNC